jgi:hypothetical protein
VNVAQHYISISEDRLRLIMQRLVETTSANRDVAAPFATLVSLVLAMATANFKNAVWFDVFLCLSTAVFVWLMVAIVRAGNRPKYPLDDALAEARGESNKVHLLRGSGIDEQIH